MERPLVGRGRNRNICLIKETHSVVHQPRSLPRKRVPTYSNCHSGHGAMSTAILLMAQLYLIFILTGSRREGKWITNPAVRLESLANQCLFG